MRKKLSEEEDFRLREIRRNILLKFENYFSKLGLIIDKETWFLRKTIPQVRKRKVNVRLIKVKKQTKKEKKELDIIKRKEKILKFEEERLDWLKLISWQEELRKKISIGKCYFCGRDINDFETKSFIIHFNRMLIRCFKCSLTDIKKHIKNKEKYESLSLLNR